MKLLYLGILLVGFLTDCIESCEIGYYSLKGICQLCPKNCATCETGSLCTMCYAGYFGGNCCNTCPSLCHNNECNQIFGDCLSCKQGYFMDGNKTCKPCPENCITCESVHVCFVCKNGYTGEHCQDVCSSCKTGTSCDKKTGYCFNDCIDGLSGELCDKPCDGKCRSCNRYKQNECNTCAPHRYGPSCNQTCSDSCVANACDDVYGNCTLGCKNGFWGDVCEKKCSLECINNRCNNINGKCNERRLDDNNKIDFIPRTDTGNMPAMTAGIISGVPFAISLIVFLACLVYRWKRRAKGSNSFNPKIENTKANNKSSGDVEMDFYAIPDNQKNDNKDTDKLLSQAEHDNNVKEDILLTVELVQMDKDTANISSRIPSLSSLGKKDETNLSQDIGTSVDGPVATFGDDQEELDLIVPIFENMKINDKPTNSSIKVTELAKYVEAKPIASFYKEFQILSKDVSGTKLSGSVTSRTQSKVPQLGLPVILDDACKTTVYTCINANFIDDGSNDSKAYIAYMGSVAVISDDMEVFWKIVWQERCSTVVMLGRRSSPEEKCTCTSEPCSVEYHDLTVECHGEIKIANFTVRKYTLRRQMLKEKVQHVQRLMFCGWPITGLPDVSSFVQFVKYAKQVKLDGPTMVYCRFGIECTGTYIALDILTKQGKDTGWVDIQGCVRHLLEQRVNMMHNDEQYKFLHKALVCSLTLESSIETSG